MVNTKSNKVLQYGKVVKFPKNTKASHAYNFLENIKAPKNKLWYILIEKDENGLQIVKYNNSEGFDLSVFVNELKMFYSQNEKLNENILKMKVVGDENFATILNIPDIELENGQKLISKITSDLVALLRK